MHGNDGRAEVVDGAVGVDGGGSVVEVVVVVAVVVVIVFS